MPKGEQKSNRETKKPKGSFLAPLIEKLRAR